ncbi:hypothetical protein [Sphingobium yanoikuyae]|uniref:hypothetical protein n=1 Tax=Sphingobium yanoikuyae TaxID=13690 RepID=UPI002FDA7C61
MQNTFGSVAEKGNADNACGIGSFPVNGSMPNRDQPGPATGRMTPTTQFAIMKFEEKERLPTKGEA